MSETCATCKFWSGREEGQATIKVFGGRCRRHAPDRVVAYQGRTGADWPATWPDYWCGEFALIANSSNPARSRT